MGDRDLSFYFFCLSSTTGIIVPFVLHDAVEQYVALELSWLRGTNPYQVPRERLEFVIRSHDDPVPH